jgi:hypothetical protein
LGSWGGKKYEGLGSRNVNLMNNNRNSLISEDKKVSNIINQIPNSINKGLNSLNLIRKMQAKFDDILFK